MFKGFKDRTEIYPLGGNFCFKLESAFVYIYFLYLDCLFIFLSVFIFVFYLLSRFEELSVILLEPKKAFNYQVTEKSPQ